MEVTTTTLFSISKTLHCSTAVAQTFRLFTSTPNTGLKSPLVRLRAAVPPLWCRLECVSNSAASFASASDDGGTGGEAKVLPSDVIILDVGGMTCGGCAASVKRILENQAQVSCADVNLTTETAIVWAVSEAKAIANWQKVMGEELAKHLTTCGFSSKLRGEA